MKKVELSIDMLNKIFGYMSKKPYEEVFAIIEDLKKEIDAFNMKIASKENEDGNNNGNETSGA
jgi:hypothetical protein